MEQTMAVGLLDERSSAPPLSFTLSQEELLVVLSVLDVGPIPGLDADGWNALSPDQQSLALGVARRGLEARELAQMGEDGQLRLHRVVLTAIGVCALSPSAVQVDHWATTGVEPKRFFGHVQGSDGVFHNSARALHHFTLAPTKTALIEMLLAACQYTAPTSPDTLTLTVSRQDFARVCEVSGAGDQAEALAILHRADAGGDAAQAFVDALSAAPRVSIGQTISQGSDNAVEERTFTLIQDGRHAWFVVPLSSDWDAPLLAQTTTRGELVSSLAGWL